MSFEEMYPDYWNNHPSLDRKHDTEGELESLATENQRLREMCEELAANLIKWYETTTGTGHYMCRHCGEWHGKHKETCIIAKWGKMKEKGR